MCIRDSPQGESASLSPTKGAEDTGAHVPNMSMGHTHNMSCQDFVSLHNSALEPIGNSEENSSIDMKKLIELIIAMKLLEEVASGSSSSNGFSTVA